MFLPIFDFKKIFQNINQSKNIYYI
jgi:hypothetical protein